jgi:hypothetical protein
MNAPSGTTTAVIAAAALGLLAAACGGGAPSAHVAQKQNGALAFSHCMRSIGVSKFPDPDSGGQIPKTQLEHLGVSDAQFQAAQRACQHLLPSGGRPPSQAQLEQRRAQALRFSQCMRAYGVPNFPDPASTGDERIPDPASLGIDQGSPKFKAANQACRQYRPPYVPSNAAYDQWARAQGG